MGTFNIFEFEEQPAIRALREEDRFRAIATLNPGIIDLIGGFLGTGSGGGGAAPAAPSAPAAPAPVPTRDPAALQLALLSLPIAVEGQPITPEYHNALRQALIALAGFVDAAAVDPSATAAVVPQLLPARNADGPLQGWDTDVGAAVQPDTDPVDVVGWMPVRLPDGLTVDTLAVSGRRTENPPITNLQVSLVRRPLVADADTASTPTLEIARVRMDADDDGPLVGRDSTTLTGTGAQFVGTAQATVPGLSSGLAASELADARAKATRVRATEFVYILVATVNADPGARVRLESIRIGLSRF